jgi:protein-disulfide isomerase
MASLVACGGSAKAPVVPQTATADAGVAQAATATALSAAPSEESAAVPIASDDATWGNRDALVTVVAFEDIQCPFCARTAPTIQKLEAEYGPEKLRVVWKHLPLPFHPNARPAAEAAEGVRALGGNDAFWKFLEQAFANQKELGADSYAKWASNAGVDATAFANGAKSGVWAAKVQRDLATAQKLGVDGTPAFLVNGAWITGAQPYEAFKQTVDAALTQAGLLIVSGTSRVGVYAAAAATNFKPQPADDDNAKDDTNVYKVPVGTSPVRGATTAPVTIVEFGDYQCPYCRRAAETLEKVRAKYGDSVRLVWKNEPLPFHPHAEPAAELALEARAEKGDAGFWAAHDALFAATGLEESDLLSIAHDLKLDVAKVKSAITTKKYAKAIEEDDTVADGFRATGTPHFFIDGRRVVGSQPLEKFVSIIDDELKKTQALATKGVTATGMYDALVAGGVAMSGPEKKDVAIPSANAPSRGASTAKVVVQEFADFQCPYCKRAEDSIDKLVAAYPGRVRIVWRNLPLNQIHPDAQLAAEAALEAQAQKGQAGFWKMHALLFANQGVDGALQREALDGYAKALGLDMKKWAAALDGHTHKDAIDADVKAADAAGVQGAPAFFINGYFLDGAMPYKSFQRLVDRALSEPAR